MKADFRQKLIDKLPLLTFLLFAIQIPMDVLSFWMGKLGMSNLVTLALGLVDQRRRPWFHWSGSYMGAL